jgi:hypothetical protein
MFIRSAKYRANSTGACGRRVQRSAGCRPAATDFTPFASEVTTSENDQCAGRGRMICKKLLQ